MSYSAKEIISFLEEKRKEANQYRVDTKGIKKLAEAIIKDWKNSLSLSLERGWLYPYSKEESLNKLLKWPETENAKFWAEEVLNLDIKSLIHYRDSLLKKYKKSNLFFRV